MAAFTHGAKVVYPSPSYDPLKVLEAVQEEKCTGLHGVPTSTSSNHQRPFCEICFLTSVYPARVVPVFISELEHPRFKEFDLSSLRTGIMGTPSSPKPILAHCWAY